MPRSAIMMTKSLKLNLKLLLPADTQDDDLSIEMPSLEQCFDWNKPLHSVIIARSRPVCTRTRQTIAIAETATGRITRRISLGKGEILSLASSPDGRTLYYAAAGSIWSIPSSGGRSKMIRTGESATMDPSGRSLVVSVTENSKVRLFRVLLGSGLEHEIVPDGSAPLTDVPLSPAALNMDGRLLLPLSSRDSWFYA